MKNYKLNILAVLIMLSMALAPMAEAHAGIIILPPLHHGYGSEFHLSLGDTATVPAGCTLEVEVEQEPAPIGGLSGGLGVINVVDGEDTGVPGLAGLKVIVCTGGKFKIKVTQ